MREHQDGLEFFSRLQDMVDTEYKRSWAAAQADAALVRRCRLTPVHPRLTSGRLRLLQRLKLKYDELLLNFAVNSNLRLYTLEEGGAAEEEAGEAPTVKGAMEAVMGGKFVNQVLCQTCPAHRSEREEDFVHVSVDVRNKRDLVESLVGAT